MWCLGIVTKEDMQEGNIEPSFLMRTANGKPFMCPNDSPRANSPPWALGSILNTEALIERYVNYRRHDGPNNYMPTGALFWFEVNSYGELMGHAIFIEKIPRFRSDKKRDDRREKYEKAIQDMKCMNSIIGRDGHGVKNELSEIKRQYPQTHSTIRKRKIRKPDTINTSGLKQNRKRRRKKG